MPADRSRPIRIFIVDDHALFRDGLVRLLSADDAFEIVGVEGSPEAAVPAVMSEQVDVLLLDYALGEVTAAAILERLRQRGFAGKILLVTAGLPDREAIRMIRGGVAGIFHKQHATDDLKRSIIEVFDGNVLIEAHYLRKLVQMVADDEVPPVTLTNREKQILGFLTEGLANKEIASELGISESAVKASLQMLFSKTGVRTRSQLVRVTLERFRDLL